MKVRSILFLFFAASLLLINCRSTPELTKEERIQALADDPDFNMLVMNPQHIASHFERVDEFGEKMQPYWDAYVADPENIPIPSQYFTDSLERSVHILQDTLLMEALQRLQEKHRFSFQDIHEATVLLFTKSQ